MSVEFQGNWPLQDMMGLHPVQGQIYIRPIVCIRKNITTQIEKQKLQNRRFFAMYSAPKLSRCQPAIERSEFWCHCFRDKMKKKFIPNGKPEFLMSESDFVDPMYVYKYKRNRKREKKFDFFYITMNNDHGFRYKGLDHFINMLETLCLEKKLKGQVLGYWPRNVKSWQIKFTPEQKKILKAAQPYLTYYWGWQEKEQLNNIMSNSKFGIYPNEMDCSPRILTECLVRDVPVLVNTDIWGGWKYVNKKTGAMFDPSDHKSIVKGIDFLLNEQDSFLPHKEFMKKYGFENSSRRLAKYINSTIYDTGCTHIYFESFGSILKQMRRIMRRRAREGK